MHLFCFASHPVFSLGRDPARGQVGQAAFLMQQGRKMFQAGLGDHWDTHRWVLTPSLCVAGRFLRVVWSTVSHALVKLNLCLVPSSASSPLLPILLPPRASLFLILVTLNPRFQTFSPSQSSHCHVSLVCSTLQSSCFSASLFSPCELHPWVFSLTPSGQCRLFFQSPPPHGPARIPGRCEDSLENVLSASEEGHVELGRQGNSMRVIEWVLMWQCQVSDPAVPRSAQCCALCFSRALPLQVH